jgi:TolB-like protein/DNA-binding winged helix-turn-helix (wHTH) protein/Tfp pilus assembly protein PilF
MSAKPSIAGATHQSYVFGEFTLDIDRGGLLRAGSDIKLRPKSFEVLRYLAERHGRLVSKNELLDSIWPNVVVTDDAVTQCLIDIRRAIGDQSQDMIRTIPRRGYIFDVTVTKSLGADAPTDESSHFSIIPGVLRWRPAATLALIVLGATVWWGFEKGDFDAQMPVEPGSAIEPPSIAVLPFLDMSPQQDQEYFADGITEEILNLLTRIPELRVIARTSSFSFKGQNADIAEISNRLNVTHVLEGSIRKTGDRVRITVQLVNASTSEHLWSETYDRTMGDIFEVQDDISAKVVGKLRITLLAPIPKTSETDPEAYRMYLQAVYLVNKVGIANAAEAESLLRKALELDPNFAPAWRELSRMLGLQISTGPSLQEDIRRTRDALARGLSIDPNDAASLAFSALHVVDFDGDIVRAARILERAIAIEPANESVVPITAIFAMAYGRPEDAVALAKYTLARNPLCRACYFRLYAAYRNAGYLDEAEATIREAQNLFGQGNGQGNAQLGIIMLLKGRPQEAMEFFNEEPDSPDVTRLFGTATAMHDLGRSEESAAAIIALKEHSDDEIGWNVAQAYAWTGQIDAAFDELNRVTQLKQLRADGDVVHWQLWTISENLRSPIYRQLHSDPRWQQLLGEIGISAEQLADVQFNITLPK